MLQFSFSQTEVGGLARQAVLDFRLSFQTNGLASVSKVMPNGIAEKAGLLITDQVTNINGEPIINAITLGSLLASVKGEMPMYLDIIRNGQAQKISLVPKSKIQEKHPHSITEYSYITLANGQKVRTILTKPKGKKGKLPAIMLVQWLSCSTTEVVNAPADGSEMMVRHFSRHPDLAFMRVEKLGVGDSDGDCATLDLHTEMAINRAALNALKTRNDVDKNNIYLLGISLGTGLSAVLGENENIKGYLVNGGCTVTWFEHMMELERRRLGFIGEPAGEINKKMSQYATLYQKYYIEKKTPQEVIDQYPHLKDIWYEDPQHQYGRPAAFYHQVQETNFEAAWQKVKVPVTVIYGEYDWIMSLADHQKIVDLVNKNKANLAKLYVVPKADHNLAVFDTPQKAFDGENAKLPAGLIAILNNWWKNK